MLHCFVLGAFPMFPSWGCVMFVSLFSLLFALCHWSCYTWGCGSPGFSDPGGALLTLKTEMWLCLRKMRAGGIFLTVVTGSDRWPFAVLADWGCRSSRDYYDMCTPGVNVVYLKNALFFFLTFPSYLPPVADNESMGRSCDGSLFSRCQWTCKEARSRRGRWLHTGKRGRAVEIFKTVSSRAKLLLGGRHGYSWVCRSEATGVVASQSGWNLLKDSKSILCHLDPFPHGMYFGSYFYAWSDDFKTTRLGCDSFCGIIPGRIERRAQNHTISMFWLH